MSSRLVSLDELIGFTERNLGFHQEDAQALWIWLVTQEDTDLVICDKSGGEIDADAVVSLGQAEKLELTITRRSLLAYGNMLNILRGNSPHQIPPPYLEAVRGTSIDGRSLLSEWVKNGLSPSSAASRR